MKAVALVYFAASAVLAACAWQAAAEGNPLGFVAGPASLAGAFAGRLLWTADAGTEGP